MNQIMTAKMLRFAGCAGLLALLVISSYAGRTQVEVPVVPMQVETVSGEVLELQTMAQTDERLEQKRKETIALLQSVLEDPSAGEEEKKKALEEKTKIAARMETEASLEALLAHMGFEQTAVIAGEETLSIIAPWQAAENEHNRVRMIDAAVSQSAFSADAVKIILSKK